MILFFEGSAVSFWVDGDFFVSVLRCGNIFHPNSTRILAKIISLSEEAWKLLSGIYGDLFARRNGEGIRLDCRSARLAPNRKACGVPKR
jgi:hypothetical protein